ncbi:MAG: ATP synthase protein I, partial [Halothiobacillaceae bacterium]
MADARKLVLLQVVIGGFVAAGFFWRGGPLGAQSAIYGAFVSVVLTALLGWGVARASQAAASGGRLGAGLLYAGAAVRFVLALVLFGVGLAALKLAPIPLIAGYCVAQVAYFVLLRMQR